MRDQSDASRLVIMSRENKPVLAYSSSLHLCCNILELNPADLQKLQIILCKLYSHG